MKKLIFILCITVLSSTVIGQSIDVEPGMSFTLSPLTIRARHYNFGFENVAWRQTTNDGAWMNRYWNFANLGDNLILQPIGWYQWGSVNYVLQLDSAVKRSGRYSTLIEQVSEGREGTFGCVVYAIPAEYAGRNIEVSAWFMGEGEDNNIGLMLRIDGGMNEILAFDNINQHNKIPAPHEWTEYSVSVRMPEDGETILIAAMLTGKGKLWVDDFRVFIDGRDIRDLQQSDLRYKAGNDDEFDEGSQITFGMLTPQMIENLALLAKVWGFLKYYHPTVASGEYNWDYVLFRAMGSMLSARNADERNTVLYRLTDGLGSFRTVRRLNFPNTGDVSMFPDLEWIDDNETLGDVLSKKLNDVKMARRDDKHYYIGIHSANHAPKFRHENDYPQISPNDDGYRMLGLFRFWNMVQYFYPYRYKMKENWHDVLTEFIPIVALADSSNHRQVFTNLVMRIGDPQIYLPSENPDFSRPAPQRLPSHELLTEEAGYIRPQFSYNSQIRQAMQDFRNTKGIIIDLRPHLEINMWMNVINWWYYFIAHYLTSTPVEFAKKSIPEIQIPGLFKYETQTAGVRNRRYYTGKIVVLVDHNTSYNGILTAMALRAMPNSVIVGSPVVLDSRANGSIKFFPLTGNFWGGMPGYGLYYPNGEDIAEIGIVPDIEVKPTTRGISEGRDEVLERAIEIVASH